MGSSALPKRKQQAEILWQMLDMSIVVAVICLVLALFIHSFVISMALGVLSLLSITVYLVIEYKIEYKLVKIRRIQLDRNPAMEESRGNILLWGVAIACLAIGTFLLHFARHGVSAADIPTSAPLYKDGIALMFLTVVTCLLAHALHQSYYFAKNLGLSGIHQARTLKSYILAFLYTFLIVYIALLILSYRTDVGLALLAGAFYLCFREFQRYDRKHQRKSLQALHKKIHLTK